MITSRLRSKLKTYLYISNAFILVVEKLFCLIVLFNLRYNLYRFRKLIHFISIEIQCECLFIVNLN